MQTNSQSNTFQSDVLSGEAAYRAYVAGIVVPDRAEESWLIDQARAGDLAGRDRVIESMQPYIWHVAKHLTTYFRASEGIMLDAQDVAQQGNVRILQSWVAALATDHPYARLRVSAWGAMLVYCRENRSAIRVPSSSQWAGARVPRVASLDAPLGGTEDLTLLDLIAS